MSRYHAGQPADLRNVGGAILFNQHMGKVVGYTVDDKGIIVSYRIAYCGGHESVALGDNRLRKLRTAIFAATPNPR